MQLKNEQVFIVFSFVNLFVTLNLTFNCAAPYTQTAVGVISKTERRPEGEQTLKNKNLAILHALIQVSKTLAPKWIGENSIFRSELKKVFQII